MNQHLAPSTAMLDLGGDAEALSHRLPLAYSKPGPDLYSLADCLGALGTLASHLGAGIPSTQLSPATGAAPGRQHEAEAARDLACAAGATGRAINALAAAQDAQLFIDHFASRYGNPQVDSDFARSRIGAHLTTARTALAEATTRLREGAAQANLREHRVRAARTRSPHASAVNARDASATSPGSSTTSPPSAKRSH